ncbi:ATP-binding protein [Streptomyces sp. NPDC001255]|uniref:ATP-binding protein n=1 Tax=Streptomyces sp. NPDC001255 TaxID=3364550 RepID=UPI0036CA849C
MDADSGEFWSVRRYAPGIDFPREIREHIRRTMGGDGEDELLHTTELVAGELVTNAVQHGGPHVVVRFLWTRGVAAVTVHDRGSRRISTLKRPAEESGRGLAIIEALGGGFCLSTLPNGTCTRWHSELTAFAEGAVPPVPHTWAPCPHTYSSPEIPQ